MKKLSRIAVSLALLLAMLMNLVAVAEPAARDDGAPIVYTHGGRVTQIDGACVAGRIYDFDDAASVVNSVLEQLGGGERTELEPWRTLDDAFGNRYYVFQQMCDNTTVLGGAVKVVTDAEGNMLGLTSSIETELPEAAAGEGISAVEAEWLVLDHVQKTRQQELNLMYGMTERMILPIALEIDIEAEDDEGGRYVWVVYSDNPDSARTASAELPYLAHYVTMTGEYLYSLPTLMPGDEAGASGFDASYVFEFMEPADYTGYVDLSNGEEKEISVTVMRDKRTGMYYLGNLERRIVVGDCWEFLYNKGNVVLEYSPDNREWDQTGLLTLYNYCRAYDYYKAIGWSGGDGLDTPILVLNNYCDANHNPVNNAAYVGGYLGWQLFLASQANDYSQCLDVLAHEFTHCVTGSVMTYNAYKNDYGAINEAMSDIQGNTCELLMEGATELDGGLGEDSTEQVRSMSDPHRFGQPEYTWDIYYVPGARTPTTLNDQGGVHSNSSLLNTVAWRLYEKAGMTLEEGRAFWFTVDCAMVPGTDYPQLAELLPWAMKLAGMERYQAELAKALEDTRMGVGDMPESFDEDRALVTLELPDNGLFDDDQTIMSIYSVNVDLLIQRGKDIFTHMAAKDYSVLPPFLAEMFEKADAEAEEEAKKQEKAEKEGFFKSLLKALFTPDEKEQEKVQEPETSDEEFIRYYKELRDWLYEYFDGVFYMANTNAGQDGDTMRMVCLPGVAIPILTHGVFNMDTTTLEDHWEMIYLSGQWFDISTLVPEEGNVDSNMLEDLFKRLSESLGDFKGLNDLLGKLLTHIEGGKVNVLDASTLADMKPVGTPMPLSGDEEAASAQPKKSRPKLEEAPEAQQAEPEQAEPEQAGTEN